MIAVGTISEEIAVEDPKPEPYATAACPPATLNQGAFARVPYVQLVLFTCVGVGVLELPPSLTALKRDNPYNPSVVVLPELPLHSPPD